jgi:hypothetical protein
MSSPFLAYRHYHDSAPAEGDIIVIIDSARNEAPSHGSLVLLRSGKRVDAFGLTTQDDKLAFQRALTQLESYL